MIFELNERNKEITIPEHSKAIVTLNLGEWHYNTWNKLFRDSWIRYANQHQYDIIVITDLLDKSEASKTIPPSWQKLLILNQNWCQNYERIVWIDSDIAINKNAPDILNYVENKELIGAYIEDDYFSLSDKQNLLERRLNTKISIGDTNQAWINFKKSFYTNAKIDFKSNEYPIINSGVIVLCPYYHKEVMLKAYSHARDVVGQEQLILTKLLIENQILHPLSPKFNWCIEPWYVLNFSHINMSTQRDWEILALCIKNEMNKSYFLHMNGSRMLISSLLEKIGNVQSIFI